MAHEYLVVDVPHDGTVEVSKVTPRSVEAWAACGEHGGCDVFSPDCPYCRDNRRNFIDYAAEQVAQARAEEREACAKIVDEWACSTSCATPGPCEHIRVAVTLAAALRARRD